MSLTFRTSGAWGPGTGANLAPADVDNNFWQLVQMVAAKATQGVGLVAFNIVGNELWATLSDHTILGPYILPVVQIQFVPGGWQPNTQYYVNQIFSINGSTYIVLVNHVSAASFDPGANDGHGNDYYGLLLSNPGNALPTGGAVGMVLEKATTVDFAAAWVWPTLAGLHDVLQSPGPTTGQLVEWQGSSFGYVSPSALVAAPQSLLELTDVLPSPGPTTGQVVTWNGSAFDFETPAPGGSTTFQGLTDVLPSPGPTTGQVVYWDGSNFTYESLTTSLLTDYDQLTTPVHQWDVFTYDLSNTRWENRQPLVYNSGHAGTFTLGISDAQNLIDIATGGAITIPTNATLAFAVGNFMLIRQSGSISSPFSFAPAGGVTLNVVSGRIAQPRAIGSIVMLQKIGTDAWEVSGDLAFDSSASALAGTGTISLNPLAADVEVFTSTPGASQTINASASPTYGQRMVLVVTTSGTSSWTLTFGTHFKSTGTLATGTVSGKVFTIMFIGDGTNFNEISRTTAM